MADQTVPWWSLLIAIIVSAAATYLAVGQGSKPSLSGVSVPSVGSLATDTITYIPHVLLLFGVLADMFTYQGVYSIPSLVGLISIPLNWVFKYFWIGLFDTLRRLGDIMASTPKTGGASTPGTPNFAGFAAVPPPAVLTARPPASRSIGTDAPKTSSFFKDYDGCTVQGFAWAATPYAPQTLVITATIFWYYILDLIMNRGWLNATAAIVTFVVLFLAETVVVGDCSSDGVKLSKYVRALMAASEGLLFGGSAYAVVQAYFPNFLPTSAIYPFPKVNVRDLKKNAAGQYVDGEGRPYIMLPNGQAIPDVMDKDGQTAWGGMLGAAKGAGYTTVSDGGDCKAKK
jgi:hypothetical protein